MLVPAIAEDKNKPGRSRFCSITPPFLHPGLEEDDDEARLVHDLFDTGYNKNVRPAQDKDLPIEVKFGIAYTQIVDLVKRFIDINYLRLQTYKIKI